MIHKKAALAVTIALIFEKNKEKETKKSVCDKSSLKRRKNLGFYETLLAKCG